MKTKSVLIATTLLLLIGCGQKGPLYLPQPAKPAPKTSDVPPQPAAVNTSVAVSSKSPNA